MDLIINNHVIDTDIVTILKDIRQITDGRYLNNIFTRGDNVGVTCPFHKDGKEGHPSCYVYRRKDNPEVPYGFYKCFTCGSQGNLDTFVAKCLNCSYEEARTWLVDNYSNALVEKIGIDLPTISLEKPKRTYLDEMMLEQYAYFHPYMFYRKLTEEVIIKFKIGWNKENDSITFPIWDEHGRLIGISERQIKNKYFHMPEGLGKPVYLLNFLKEENITETYVVESQIDALYLWSLGKPAIALFGTGSKAQYEILRRSGIRLYHLAFDGDMAGKHGAKRFINNMPMDVFIDIAKIPDGKDINDLTPDEINNLEFVDKNYLQADN